MSKKLQRSQSNKVFMGLCGGIGNFFSVDPTLVRIAFIILEFATGGLLILFYFIIAFFVPKELNHL